MTTPHRILLAGLFHETNTFAPGRMGLDQFRITRAEDDWSLRENDGSPTGAFLAEARQEGWNVIPTIDIRGTPGAMPDEEVFATFLAQWDAQTAQLTQPPDAIFLVLHGAMVSPGHPDPEGALLRHLRAHPLLGNVPIFGVLDLHANYTETMAALSNGLLVYRKNPHTDAAETATRAARLMATTLTEKRTLQTHFVPTDLLWPPTGTGTADEPMKTLEALARSEEHSGIEEINVFAGFSHADVPHAGVAFSIVYDPAQVTPERLDNLAQRLRQTAHEHRTKGLPPEWPLDTALSDALAKKQYPTLLVEPADNIGGGAPGDGTAILRALLSKKQETAGSGVILCDPESVAALADCQPGEERDLQIGGKTFSLDPGPIPVRARLIRKTDGRFTLEDRHSHAASMSGIHHDMGPCAVVDVDGITILLTSRRAAPMDLGQWRSQGVNPEELKIIGVKAAVAHRQAYDKIAKASYWVNTPGPCTSDLGSLPYKHIRRPIFPLDPEP